MKALIIARIKLTAAVFAALFSLHCADLSGGGSEAGNARIIGRVLNTQGTPASNVKVMVTFSGFDPVKESPLTGAAFDTTGTDGIFVLTVRKSRTYTIQAVHITSRRRALIAGVAVGDTDIAAPQCTLNAPGAVKVMLPDSADKTLGYLFVPGTTVLTFLNNAAGFVVLDSVPAGIIPAIYYSSIAISASAVIRYDVTVAPGDTTVVYNPSWKYAKSLFLNTTASGANVSGDVYNFPILVKLTAGNFTFAQAQADGRDLRFAKNDGTPLPYELERYDAGLRQAEIWVKVDTVFGNDSSHFITMYWGNPATASESNGQAVFDTAAGFAAVWHLDSDCSDATAGNHSGTNFGAADTAGIIGGANKFDGSSYLQVPGLLGAPPSITISAWVHLDSAVGYGQEIVSLGDAVAIRADQNAPDGTAGFFCSKVSGSDTVHVFTNTRAVIVKTGWRYLVYTVDADRHVQSMYIDGTFQCSTNDINPINYSGLGSNTFLGAHGNKKTQSYAFGCIDEARVCRVARTADWIKLCYMNQKEQDALVKW